MAKLPTQNQENQPVNQQRVYKGTEEFDHDLFKLELATMLKNVSYTEIPDYEKVEHVHFFHTVDSNGKKQTTCTPIGGHFHEIQVFHNPSGVPSITVGPAVKFVQKKVRGRFVRVLQQLEDDTHTHAVTYKGSERFKKREANMEFAKLETAIRARQEPTVEGVISG